MLTQDRIEWRGFLARSKGVRCLGEPKGCLVLTAFLHIFKLGYPTTA